MGVYKLFLIDLEGWKQPTGRKQAKAVQRERLSGRDTYGVIDSLNPSNNT